MTTLAGAAAGSGRSWAAPRTLAGWTVAGFGAMALIFGAVGLLRPDTVLAVLGFEVVGQAQRVPGDHTRVFVTASSMASFNMGVYYLLAAATEWRAFYRFTVVFRLLTWAVFSSLVVLDVAPVGFLGVALWEAAGAVATGLAMVADGRRAGARSPAGQ